jgi:CheY-like chemotaxis protein
LQRELLQSQKLESIGTLAGGIAHDFNNLLAVILGNASVHQRDRSLSSKMRDSLADIVDAAERGSSLTHQLLVYARGGLQQPMPTDLNVLIESVMKMLRRTTPPQIEFVLDLPVSNRAIMADPGQIEQVLMNLCLNAIQASSPPCNIEISTSPQTIDAAAGKTLDLEPGEYIRLQVKDYGCGMDAHTQDRIFEPFFSTKFTGRGMGLAATLGIIKSHRGQIQVVSTPGSGTTMSVWLPVTTEVSKARPVSHSIKMNHPPHGSETILVIDDDAAVTRTVQQILSSLGYCVVVHTDAGQAITFLDTNAEDINLVVLDLNMPKYSGAYIFKEVRERCPQTPILLASGFDDAEVIEPLQAAGAAGFLRKPFTIVTLAKAIRTALDESPTSPSVD